jgi:hypothetical protein
VRECLDRWLPVTARSCCSTRQRCHRREYTHHRFTTRVVVVFPYTLLCGILLLQQAIGRLGQYRQLQDKESSFEECVVFNNSGRCDKDSKQPSSLQVNVTHTRCCVKSVVYSGVVFFVVGTPDIQAFHCSHSTFPVSSNHSH